MSDSHSNHKTSLILGATLAVLCIILPVRADNENKTKRWQEFSDLGLGVKLKYPNNLKLWKYEDAIYLDLRSVEQKKTSNYNQEEYIDRALNGRFYSNDGLYLMRLSLGKGSFHAANRQYSVFKRHNGGLVATSGRFTNLPAKKLKSKNWSGYESTIMCSVFEESSFHAAGGMCYWGLISDDHSFAIADTRAINPDEEEVVRAIYRSIVFIRSE